jgi:multiple sugar transport system permease protein
MEEKTFLQKFNEQKVSYLFIALPLTLFFVFQLAPVVISFFWSFTEYNVVNSPQFVGFANYRQLLFDDPVFWIALRNTAVYVIGVVPLGVVMALLLAVAIDQKISFKNFFKSIFFLPTVTAIVAVSVIWKWMYAGEKYGLFNFFLLKWGFQPVDWLVNPAWTLPAIMIMSIWAGLGYSMILFLAGLQTIPQSMYEASEIDGAGFWQRFWYITVPLLKPTIVFVSLVSFIFSFQAFEQVYIMTGGQGGIGGVLNSALTIVAYLYDRGFVKFQMGYASAIAYVIFAIVFFVTLLNRKLMRSNVEY